MLHQTHKVLAVVALFYVLPSLSVGADLCITPIAPLPASEVLAREYRVEFRADFEAYFRDAQSYLACMEQERQSVVEEIKQTTNRYARFLDAAKTWDANPSGKIGEQP